MCTLSCALSTNSGRGKEKCNVESCSSDDSKGKYWEQTNKQTDRQTPISHRSFPALVQMRCELGTDTKGTPKGWLSLDKAGHRNILFCQASHRRDAWKGKKEDILHTEKCSEGVDVCQQNLQESFCRSLLYMFEFYLVPFINLHHVLLWAMYSPV